jgi:hypothetical protein
MEPSLRRKLLISGFIFFHFGCVLVSVFPGRFRARDFLLSRSLPLPTRRPEPGKPTAGWHLESQPLIAAYLGKSGQWQNWNLFAPNPIPFSRHLGGTVTHRSGESREYTLPRVEQLGYARAHLEARFREYQYGLAGPLAVRQDLARFFARSLNDPANPPVHVSLYVFQLEIPAPSPRSFVDYPRLLRDDSRYVRHPLVEYDVTPEDLR